MCVMYHLTLPMGIHHANFYCAAGASRTSYAIVTCCMLSVPSFYHILSRYRNKAQVSAHFCFCLAADNDNGYVHYLKLT